MRHAAKEADISVNTLRSFENGGTVLSTTIAKLRAAYEAAGVEIVGEDTIRVKGSP